MPLAVWAYFFNPRIFTDLPRWPGMLAVVPTMLISNGLLLYYFHRNTQEYIGSVRRRITAPGRCRPPLGPLPRPLDAKHACSHFASRRVCGSHQVRVCRVPQVRWLHGVWLVWRKPRDLAARGKAA